LFYREDSHKKTFFCKSLKTSINQSYSYLNESIGSRLAALYAGIRPEITPITILSSIDIIERLSGNDEGKKFPIRRLKIYANVSPIIPATKQIVTASIKN
jgi:hypothetical protein